MSDGTSTVEFFYQGWDHYQSLLIQAVAPLSSAQLALRVTPSLRSIGELAAHIARARATIFHACLGEGDTELKPFLSWDQDGEQPQTKSELIRGLEATWPVIQQCLTHWSPGMLAEDVVVTADNAGRLLPRARHFTRQALLFYAMEHDMHHGGELFLTLGAYGLPTPDVEVEGS